MKTKLLFILLLSTNTLFSQTIIKGIVRDSLKQAIPFVNIYSTDANKQIHSFTTTNNEGKYELKISKPGKFHLHYNSLNYKEKIISIVVNDSAFAERQKNITLIFETKQIKAVNVEAANDIIEKKDTIVFRAESFLTGNENVVGDLLKKLPGVEVSDKGNVSVNGKAVSKLMVEGDDLFDQNYQIVVKNLDVSAIDKVEILNDFSENILLKDIENSDDIAMNLTIKEGKKYTIFGDLNFGTDFYEKYTARTNLVGFYKKVKFYSISSLNNVGTDPVDAIYMLLNPNFMRQKKTIGDGVMSDNFVNVYQPNMPNFSLSRYNFNKAAFSSLNTIFNPSDKLKIKLLLYYYGDENTFRQTTKTDYLLGAESFSNQEEFNSLKNTQSIYARLDLDYWLSSTSTIDYTGKFQINDLDYSTNLHFNSQPLKENLIEDKKYFDHELLYTKKINKKEALTVTLRFLQDNNRQNYTVNPFFNTELHALSGNNYKSYQVSENPITYIGSELNYMKRFGKSNFNIIPRIQYTEKELVSGLQFRNDEANINADNKFINSYRFTRKDFSTLVSFRFPLKKTFLSLSSNLWFTDFNNGENTTGKFYIEPKITIKRALGEKASMISSYSLNTNFSEINEIFPNYIQTGFNSYTSGYGKINTSLSDVVLFNFRFGNWTDKWIFNFMLFYINSHNNLTSNVEVYPNYSFNSKLLSGSKQSVNFNFNLDRYFKSLYTNVKFNYSLSFYEYTYSVNSGFRNLEAFTHNYKLSFRTVFDFFMNFNVGANLLQTKLKQSYDSEVYDFISFGNIFCKFNSKFNIDFKNKIYKFDLKSKGKLYKFSDISLNYIIKKDKLTLKLYANNLFNEKQFAMKSISDFSIVSKTNYLIPRNFILKAQYKF